MLGTAREWRCDRCRNAVIDHPDARLRRTVLEVIKRRGNEATLGDLLLDTKMKKRPIAEMLDAMVESGTVLKLNTPIGVVYRVA